MSRMRRRDPLLALARLERQALDHRRGVLVAARGELARLEAAVVRHHAAWSEAMTLAATAEAELDLWGELSRGTRQVHDRVETARAAQAVAVGEAQADVHASLVELKRLEVLAGRRAARSQAEAASAERRMLDELATLRHGRR
jgi:flagellar export protein FliJ